MSNKFTKLILASAVALLVGACSDDSNGKYNTRFVDQTVIDGPIPLGRVDDAVRASAKTSVSTLVSMIQSRLLTKHGGNFGGLKRELDNTNGAQLLTILGLDAGLLNNSHYRSTDFQFTFNSGKMQVVAMPGKDKTRGHFTAEYPIGE